MTIVKPLATAAVRAAVIGFALLSVVVAGVELVARRTPASLIVCVALAAGSRLLLGSFLWGAAFMGAAVAILAPASPGLLLVTVAVGMSVSAATAVVLRIRAAPSAISDRREGARAARI